MKFTRDIKCSLIPKNIRVLSIDEIHQLKRTKNWYLAYMTIPGTLLLYATFLNIRDDLSK